MNKNITIVTHNGIFHGDDVLAVAMLKKVHPAAGVIRTRDPELIEGADFVVDVGGVFEPSQRRFDHHQPAFTLARPNGVPYASAGLVGLWMEKNGWLSPDELARLDEGFLQYVDAVDNGYTMGVRSGGVDFSAIVSSLNPNWTSDPSPADFDRSFDQAVDLAKLVFERQLASIWASSMAADLVHKAIEQAEDNRLITFGRFCPWQEILCETAPEALYVIFPDVGEQWRLQAVPVTAGSFEQRKPLPASWAGLRADELAAVTGVEDSVFCHKGRFIAGAKTKDGVLALAQLALEA